MNVAHWGYLRSLLSGEITRLAALQQMRHTTPAEIALYQLQSQLCADLMVSANLGTLPESALTDRLTEAEALIAELEAHEGAEGWSADLRARLDRYSENYPSPQSPTAAYADDETPPAPVEDPGALLERYDQARHNFITASPARIDIISRRQKYEQLRAEVIRAMDARRLLQENMRETFEGMVAMRDTINEVIPLPSLESDLLQGPENSVFFATVAEAVVSAVRALREPKMSDLPLSATYTGTETGESTR